MASLTNEILYIRDAIRATKLDRRQHKQFGPDTPLFAERIWVKTSECVLASSHKISRRKSGLVEGGDWDMQANSISEIPKIRNCLRHWQDGLSWEKAGAFDHMLELIRQKSGAVDGVSNLQEIKDRYALLDQIYAQAQADGMLQTVETIRGKTFRESGGILIHLNRAGAPLFGNAGHHRIAIAISLGLSHFPAQLGMIHSNALPELKKYRLSPGGFVK